MSIARRAPPSTVGRRPRAPRPGRRRRSDRRSGRGSSRPRSSARAPRPCPGTSRCRTRRRASNAARLRVVVEAEHRAARQIRTARLDLIARGGGAPAADAGPGCRRRPGRCSSGSRGCRRWISSPLRRWNSESTSASRPPQYGQRRMSSSVQVRIDGSSTVRRAARGSSRRRARLERRRGGNARRRASAALRLRRSRRSGCSAPIWVRWQRSAASLRGTQSRTSTTNVGGLAPSPNASGVDAPEARIGRRAALGVRRFDDSPHDALRHRHVVERRRVGAERQHGGVGPLVHADVIEMPVEPVLGEGDDGVRPVALGWPRRFPRAAPARRSQRRSPSG